MIQTPINHLTPRAPISRTINQSS